MPSQGEHEFGVEVYGWRQEVMAFSHPPLLPLAGNSPGVLVRVEGLELCLSVLVL